MRNPDRTVKALDRGSPRGDRAVVSGRVDLKSPRFLQVRDVAHSVLTRFNVELRETCTRERGPQPGAVRQTPVHTPSRFAPFEAAGRPEASDEPRTRDDHLVGRGPSSRSRRKTSKTTLSLAPPKIFLLLVVMLCILILPTRSAHAAISYVGSASRPADNGAQAGPGPVAVTPPAMQAGDFVLLIGAYRLNTTISISETGGQTWTSLTASQRGIVLTTGIFYCAFNGTWTANPSISIASGTAGLSAIMHVFRGVDPTTPLDVAQVVGNYAAPASPYNVTITGITTNTDGAWVIAVWGCTLATGPTWSLQTAGWANAGGAQYRNTTGTDISISAAYKAVSPAGASGNVTNRESAAAQGTSHILALRPGSPPPVPVATAATDIQATSFSANWNASAGAIGYVLDVATDSGFTSFVTGYRDLIVGDVLTYPVTSLSAGTTYYYRVRAYSATGVSDNSNTISLTTVPSTPVATAATSIGATSFSANWGTSTGATGYRLDVATDSGFGSFVTGYSNLDVGNVLTYSVSSNISPNTTYYYRVRAYNTGGTSGSSNTISLTTVCAGPGIAVDTVTSGTGTGTPVTVSHTTSGTGRLMLVGISGAVSSGTVAVSGVTYGGVALSLVGTATAAAYQKTWIYQLVAPATGTANVVVTFSTAPNTGAVVGVMTFTGVDQSVPLGTFAGANGTSAAPSVNVSSASGELVFDTVNHYWPLTVGANQTQRWNTGSGSIYGGGSSEPGAATVTMSWTASGSDTWAIGAVPIKPAALACPPVATAATNILPYSFSANWNASSVATGYQLDVATDSGFSSFVTGFNNLDVGNVLTYSVSSNIAPNTTYYYRVRAYNANGTSGNSNTINLTTDIGGTLLTFNSKYVVTSSTAVTNATTSLADDTQASQTFSLAATQTVLVIYSAFNNSGSTEVATGKQIAINVDTVNYANTWNSPYAANGADGATTFWIGTLGAGSHTIKGRFAANTASTVTINERVLLILILDGDAYGYIDNSTAQTTTSATLVNDPNATQAFTPSGACKALILYNVGNSYGSTENQNGKYAAINLGGTNYSQLIKSAGATAGETYSDNVFTLHYAALTATSYTAQGTFAARFGSSTAVTISRRQLGVLLFADSTLADYVTSGTSVNTTSLYPVNDAQALISRTTADTRELLVVATGGSDYQASSTTGLAYGIQVDTNDRTKSRTSPRAIAQNSSNSSTAWAETLAAAAHTVRGRYGNNAGTTAEYVTSRRVVALWFPVPPSAPVATDATNIQWYGFSANWNASAGATGYRLDVATDSGFTSFVTGYSNLDVGNVLTYSVSSNIAPNTTYYYRVRAYNGNGTSGNSNTINLTTGVSTLLTFSSKYVVTSVIAVTTTSTSLQDDTQASQTFSLTGSQTVLVIYQANNLYGIAMPATGMQNAISVDSTDVAKSWDSPWDSTYVARNTVFWIGTLGSGSHTITGRFASNTASSTATVSNRVLLIYILNGNAFLYDDDPTSQTTTSATFVNDPSASFTFTPSGSCKALILYNVANSGATEAGYGKKAAIRVGSTDYSQAEKSASAPDYADSVFTLWATSLSAVSTTVLGKFAVNNTGTVTVNRRQLGVLLFDDTTLLDLVNSDTEVTTTSSSLVDDAQATINRTTSDTRELLVVAMGTKRWSVTSYSSDEGECYGIMLDGTDRANSRGSCSFTQMQTGEGADSAATAYAQNLAAASHTIKGRFSNNTGTTLAMIDSRRIAALWFPAPPPAPVATAATNIRTVQFLSELERLVRGDRVPSRRRHRQRLHLVRDRLQQPGCGKRPDVLGQLQHCFQHPLLLPGEGVQRERDERKLEHHQSEHPCRHSSEFQQQVRCDLVYGGNDHIDFFAG